MRNLRQGAELYVEVFVMNLIDNFDPMIELKLFCSVSILKLMYLSIFTLALLFSPSIECGIKCEIEGCGG